MRLRRFPWLTLVVFTVTATTSLWAQADPAVLHALERDPHGFSWSRLATPLLVQSDGWGQIVVNLVALLFFGYHAEVRFGRWRWLTLYLGAGLVGQALGYVWQPTGAGNSVAVCGLVGGLATVTLRGRRPAATVALMFAAYLVVELCGQAVAGWAGAVVGLVTTVALVGVSGRWGGPRLLAGIVVVAAIVTSIALDHHGPSVLMGGVLGLLVDGAAEADPLVSRSGRSSHVPVPGLGSSRAIHRPQAGDHPG